MRQNQPRNVADGADRVSLVPLGCTIEQVAAEIWERCRWGERLSCVHCAAAVVYKMTDAGTGDRNKRYLWRCRACRRQFTVRVGTILESSRIPLHQWFYALWRACTSEDGAAAMEIHSQTGLSYKSSLKLLHRIRCAMPSCGEGAPAAIRATAKTHENARPGPREYRLKLNVGWEDAAKAILQDCSPECLPSKVLEDGT